MPMKTVVDLQVRRRILIEMGFVKGNLAFDKMNKRVVLLSSDVMIDEGLYDPKIDAESMTDEDTPLPIRVASLFTLEMVPDILDGLRVQMGEKKTISSERLIEEIRETNHEIALLVKGLLRKRKDDHDRLQESNSHSRE